MIIKFAFFINLQTPWQVAFAEAAAYLFRAYEIASPLKSENGQNGHSIELSTLREPVIAIIVKIATGSTNICAKP